MPAVDASHDDVWVKVLALARAVDSRSYYQLLGVNMDAAGEELRLAFHKSAALLRSLRSKIEGVAERRQAIEVLISRLQEAHQTLADPMLRRRYDEGLESGVLRLHPSEPDQQPAAPPPERMRADTRHPFAAMVRVRCAKWEDFLTLHANNISTGGLFVKTATPLARGTAVRLRIVLPEQYTLELEAEVVRVVQGKTPGMGLTFRPMDDFRKSIVEHLVGQARAADTRVAELAEAAAPESVEDEEITTPYATELPDEPPAAAGPPRLADYDLFSQPIEARVNDAIASLSIDELVAEARQALAAGLFILARDKFAEAIKVNTRDLSLRAGFHLASGYDAKQHGRMDEAFEHFERVLIFDKTCREAIRELRSS